MTEPKRPALTVEDIDIVSILAHNLTRDQQFTTLYGDRASGWIVEKDMGKVLCLDCGWQGQGYQLLAQACPVCDGRCADL